MYLSLIAVFAHNFAGKITVKIKYGLGGITKLGSEFCLTPIHIVANNTMMDKLYSL